MVAVNPHVGSAAHVLISSGWCGRARVYFFTCAACRAWFQLSGELLKSSVSWSEPRLIQPRPSGGGGASG